MKDQTKRKLIRFFDRTDHVSGKAARYKGWSPKLGPYDESGQKRYYDAELDRLSGRELDRELLRQLLYTLPVALFLLLILVAAVLVIVRSFI